MKEGTAVIDYEKGCESICDDPLAPSPRPLGDYIGEYNRIYEQIQALEGQIDMLDKNRQRLKITSFDQHIHQLGAELCRLKTEIEPIALLVCKVVSQTVFGEDKEYFIEHIFLRHSIREIAMNHNVTGQSVSLSINRCSKIQVPNDVVEKYGKVFTE